VILDRLTANGKSHSNLLILEAVCDQKQHFLFTRAKKNAGLRCGGQASEYSQTLVSTLGACARFTVLQRDFPESYFAIGLTSHHWI
jgi:hypothetical protein